jgi:hypothetical protein
MATAKFKPIIVSVRYTLKHPRIISLISAHQDSLSKLMMESVGSPINVSGLLKYMSISTNRWKKILEGAEPTLGEAIRYGSYYKIELSSLYEKLPVKTK